MAEPTTAATTLQGYQTPLFPAHNEQLDTKESKEYDSSQHSPLDLESNQGHKDADDATSVADSELPQGRNLGLFSATFLMVNRMVGTGVFATTSTILQQSGSVGMSLMCVPFSSFLRLLKTDHFAVFTATGSLVQSSRLWVTPCTPSLPLPCLVTVESCKLGLLLVWYYRNLV